MGVTRLTQFDRGKLRAAILHTCKSCPPDRLGAVKLHKVLYFLDMVHYAQRGTPVTGASYRKRPFGPTCVQLLPMLRDMERAGELEVITSDYFGYTKTEYRALADAEQDVLNDSELDLLNDVIDFVCNRNSARSISDFSHKLPWEQAEYGEEISYRSALLLYPIDITPEAFEAAGAGLEDIADTRQRSNTLDFPLLSDFRGRVRAAAGQARL